jgi:hypothetical protein
MFSDRGELRLRFVAKRVELYFAPGIIVEFTDRDRGVRLVYEIGERSTRFPLVYLPLRVVVNQLGLNRQLKC